MVMNRCPIYNGLHGGEEMSFVCFYLLQFCGVSVVCCFVFCCLFGCGFLFLVLEGFVVFGVLFAF